ncbi:hypothetical protein Tco_0463813, partial [Tanacetum coccineum]
VLLIGKVPTKAFSLLNLQKMSILLPMMLLRKVHYLREVIEFGDIKLEKVHTDENLANPITKALAFSKHSENTKNIGMLPASSLM